MRLVPRHRWIKIRRTGQHKAPSQAARTLTAAPQVRKTARPGPAAARQAIRLGAPGGRPNSALAGSCRRRGRGQSCGHRAAGRTVTGGPLAHLGVLAVLAVASVAVLPTAAHAATVPRPRILSGLDEHDGTVVKYRSTYYLYGTEYRCGFTWMKANTPFCGFVVRTAHSVTGHWSPPQLLFSPKALDNWGPDKGRSWNWVCGSTGAGCFNPRMLRRPDGVWLLWFNAPRDTYDHHVNAYYVMGCNGPAGPCGYQAGGHGSTHKPRLEICDDDGDFSVITKGGAAAILCSMGGISEESLSKWWTDGTGAGTRSRITPFAAGTATPAAILPVGEGVGAYQRGDGAWVMVYSSPGCGYCSGPPALKTAGGTAEVHAGYATAPAMMGPWTVRGVLSPAYCTGQPRTVFTVGRDAFEWLDQWTGTRNETKASIRLEPMAARPWSCQRPRRGPPRRLPHRRHRHHHRRGPTQPGPRTRREAHRHDPHGRKVSRR